MHGESNLTGSRVCVSLHTRVDRAIEPGGGASQTYWHEVEDEAGQKFYQSRDTDETSWTLPQNGTVL